MESCRWFKNIKFGRQLTNLPPPSPVVRAFNRKKNNFSINSTGPIIEEVFSEEEVEENFGDHVYQDLVHSPSTSSSVSAPSSLVSAPYSLEPAPSSRLRRSQRTHRRPLDFARCQRLIYNLQGDLVKEDPGFPETYDYSRRKRNPVRVPENAKKARVGDYWFKTENVEGIIRGHIYMNPNGFKPTSKTNATTTYVFVVKSGQVTFTVSGEHHKLDSKTIHDNIIIKQGQRYSAKNSGQKGAHIIFFVCDQD